MVAFSGPRCNVREAHLIGWPRVHHQARPRADLRNHQGHAVRARPVLRERDQRGQLQRDSISCLAEGQ